MSKTLDLGSGPNPKNPFNADEVFGVDLGSRPDISASIVPADLVLGPIPFATDSFDFVTAYDFIEHIPRVIYLPERRQPFIELMNEIYRVLMMGGHFLSHTPAFPNGAAFVDPTHVNIITEGTFPLYFGDNRPDCPWAAMYGFVGSFRMVSQEWQGPHLMSVMQKIPRRNVLNLPTAPTTENTPV
jgi:SAM-dependent methyltransferase